MASDLEQWYNFDAMLATSTGTLHYSYVKDYGYKLIVQVDPEIVRYARALVPKHIELNGTRYAPHITVIRRETPKVKDAWGDYDGESISFKYSPIVQTGKVYFWLNAWSDRLLEIRKELGLAPYRKWNRPPDGTDCFHITIGNLKKIEMQERQR